MFVLFIIQYSSFIIHFCKGEYQTRYDEIAKLYEGVKDANIENELTSELVGDYLFTDSDFISKLSTENRNVFQKVYDEIKYLCKVATAGSKEARQLEKVKRAFEKAYKESGKAEKNNTAEGGVRFSLTRMGFDEFSRETANNIKMRNGIIIESVSALEEHIENALKRNGKSNLYIGAISDHVKQKIEADINTKIFKEKQYSFVVSYDDIIHIAEHFGEDVQKLTDEVIKLYDIIKNYDTVELDVSDKGVKKLVFDKSYSDYDYRTVEIASNKKATLDLVTLFVTKNNIKKRSQSVPPAAKSGSQWGSASNNSISNPNENVKQNTNLSLSSEKTTPKKYGNYNVYGEDIKLQPNEDIAPVRDDVQKDLLSTNAKSFGITKPGDYVHVQRQVFDTLSSEGFFSDEESRSRTVTNLDSSMQVEINKKGIKETFNFDNYGKLGKKNKALKLATVRKLPEIIQKGKLINDDINNYHSESSSVKFAYIESVVKVDGKDVSVKIDIKKSPQKNKFWVHSIDVIERVDGLPADTSRVLKRANEHIDSTDSISNTTEKVNTEDIAPVREDVKTRAKKTDNEGNSIKEQLRSSQEMLNKMEIVANIKTPKEFSIMNKAAKQNWVIQKLKSTNYEVERKNFGVISFAKKHLKSAFNYFKSDSAEEVTFEALPYVLENGVEISNREEHKGRGYGTVTIAGPISINGKRGNMAVVVKRSTGNYYKVHRILTPDGSVFNLSETTKEAEPTPAGESLQSSSLATPIGSASNKIIPEKEQKVNAENKPTKRSELHTNIVENIRNKYTEKGFNRRG